MPQEARYDQSLLSDEEIHALTRIPKTLTRVERDMPHILAALPAVIEAIQQAMRPMSSGGGGGVQCSDVTDRVFAEVAGREKGHNDLRAIVNAVVALGDASTLLVALVTNQRRVADAETVRQAVDAVRCSGMGKQGYARGRHGEGWGDETCRRNAVHDGICSVCLDHRWAWVKDPTYVRAIDRRVGARLPSLAGINQAAGIDNLRARADRIIEDVA